MFLLRFKYKCLRLLSNVMIVLMLLCKFEDIKFEVKAICVLCNKPPSFFGFLVDNAIITSMKPPPFYHLKKPMSKVPFLSHFHFLKMIYKKHQNNFYSTFMTMQIIPPTWSLPFTLLEYLY